MAAAMRAANTRAGILPERGRVFAYAVCARHAKYRAAFHTWRDNAPPQGRARRGGAPRPQIAIARGEKIAYNDEIKLRLFSGNSARRVKTRHLPAARYARA